MAEKAEKKIELPKEVPVIEPECESFLKFVTPTKDGYKVPNGPWKADGTPGAFIDVDKRVFNIMVWKLNIDILNKKIGVYESVNNVYKSEIKRLTQLDKDSIGEATTDFKELERQLTKVKLMWEHYRVTYRNKQNTPAAKQYRERIIAIQKSLPKKRDYSEYRNVTERDVDYNLDLVEASASRVAKNQPDSGVPYVITTWNGDIADLISKYESKISKIDRKYIDPMKDRKKLNEKWLQVI